MEVWGEGETWEELRAAIDAYPEERKAPWLDEGKAFKIAVETYGHKMGQDRQVDAINKLNFLEFKVGLVWGRGGGWEGGGPMVTGSTGRQLRGRNSRERDGKGGGGRTGRWTPSTS